MELYLLKSTICLALLFVFYKMILENSSKHHFKRFYLLGSIAAAFLIPLITFTTYINPSQTVPIYTVGTGQIMLTEIEEAINYWPIVLWTIYGLGIIFFSVKFFRNIYFLIQKIRQNAKVEKSSFIHVLLNEAVIPHTFFSYIFSNKKEFETGKIPAEVMLHEEAHASQRHSLDIILIEILKIVFWFNPLFYFLKRSIKLNHEFLADQAVLKNGIETLAYQKLLLAFSTPDCHSDILTPSLAHSINYSSMKKRFSIMKTNTSRRAILFRSLLILPLLSFLIYGFSTTKEIIKIKEESSNNIAVENITRKIELKVSGNNISLNGTQISLESFADALNKITEDWEKTDFSLYALDIQVENTTDDFRTKLNTEYRKTFLAKQSGLEFPFIVYPTDENKLISSSNSSLDHINKVVKKDGLFYYEGKKISRENAKKIIINNPSLNIATQNIDSNKSITTISKNPINFENEQQKATKAEIKEYNKLAKEYNAVDINKLIILKKDMERLESIYKKMSDEQKAKAEPFPKSIPPPPPNKTGYNFNQKINTNIPTPPTPSFYNNDKNVKNDGSTVFIYEDRVITTEKANELLFNNQNDIFTLISKENGQEVIRLSKSPMENGKKFVVSTPSPFTLINTSSEPNKGIHGATYYYNDKVITPEKADELLKNNSKLRVYINKTDDGKGTITLSEKPILSKNNTTPPTPPIPPKPNSPNKND